MIFFIIQMDYGCEGLSKPIFVTDCQGEVDAFVLGVENSQGTRCIVTELNTVTGEIKEQPNDE